jgi:hypothetical protein
MTTAKVTKRTLDKLAGEQAPPRRMRMDRRYRRPIDVGLKLQTTRRGLKHLHRGQRVDFDFADGLPDVPVSVTGQHFRTLDSLTVDDAMREGLTSVSELQIALLEHYPDLQPSELLTCIRFRRESI